MSRKCIINIYSSYNNILMTATDQTGAETIAKCSGGQVTKKGSDKGSQFAAIRVAKVATRAQILDQVHNRQSEA
jgi:small subunit ribosomal protein S11